MKQSILIACLSFILGVIIGSVTKHCPKCDCVEYTHPKVVNKVIERAKVEIKKETHEEIKKIHNADVTELDSIWRDYAKRHGSN